MSNYEQDNLQESAFDKKELPTGLNVLTILTFIGCAIGLLSSVWSFISAKKSYDERDKVMDQMNNPDMPSFAKKMMGDPEQFMLMITKGYENRIPILIVSLISIVLCFVGTLQMRKLQKQGFLIYTIGQLLGIVSVIFFIGTFMVTTTSFLIAAAIGIIFIAMYAVNRKHLVY